MPPAGYPAFLQYLQSGRVRKVQGSDRRHGSIASRNRRGKSRWLRGVGFSRGQTPQGPPGSNF